MKVLLSIKPEYAEKIFNGEKLFEFRKVIFKNKDIKKIVVYESSPVCKVIGEFEIETIISKEINILWQETKCQAGISENFFFSYFSDRLIGHAIKVKNSKKYECPRRLDVEFGIRPPQSFVYLNN